METVFVQNIIWRRQPPKGRRQAFHITPIQNVISLPKVAKDFLHNPNKF